MYVCMYEYVFLRTWYDVRVQSRYVNTIRISTKGGQTHTEKKKQSVQVENVRYTLASLSQNQLRCQAGQSQGSWVVFGTWYLFLAYT